jgi:hypothetical protein
MTFYEKTQHPWWVRDPNSGDVQCNFATAQDGGYLCCCWRKGHPESLPHADVYNDPPPPWKDTRIWYELSAQEYARNSIAPLITCYAPNGAKPGQPKSGFGVTGMTYSTAAMRAARQICDSIPDEVPRMQSEYMAELISAQTGDLSLMRMLVRRATLLDRWRARRIPGHWLNQMRRELLISAPE